MFTSLIKNFDGAVIDYLADMESEHVSVFSINDEDENSIVNHHVAPTFSRNALLGNRKPGRSSSIQVKYWIQAGWKDATSLWFNLHTGMGKRLCCYDWHIPSFIEAMNKIRGAKRCLPLQNFDGGLTDTSIFIRWVLVFLNFEIMALWIIGKLNLLAAAFFRRVPVLFRSTALLDLNMRLTFVIRLFDWWRHGDLISPARAMVRMKNYLTVNTLSMIKCNIL